MYFQQYNLYGLSVIFVYEPTVVYPNILAVATESELFAICKKNLPFRITVVDNIIKHSQ